MDSCSDWNNLWLETNILGCELNEEYYQKSISRIKDCQYEVNLKQGGDAHE